jgi:hypothetical protein
VSEWWDKPWHPGRPTSVVLYLTPEDGWRFALTTDRPGILDGCLGLSELAPDEAKAVMLQRLLTNDQVEWTATGRPKSLVGGART